MPPSRDDNNSVQFIGFFWRSLAHIIDSMIIMMLLTPALTIIYGLDYWLDHQQFAAKPLSILLNYILPALAVLLFWKSKGATPGKMAAKAVIVDANSLEAPSSRQLLIRYIGYFVSLLPLGLGFFWVAWDRRKQGFHDKLSNTVVIAHA